MKVHTVLEIVKWITLSVFILTLSVLITILFPIVALFYIKIKPTELGIVEKIMWWFFKSKMCPKPNISQSN